MRAADQAHTSSAVSHGTTSQLLARVIAAALATLALLLVWRPAVLHAQAGAAAQQESATRSHVVKAGETLWGLAARYYGDGHQWKTLAERNRIPTDGSSPLRVGMRLSVPATAAARGTKAAEVAAAPADSTVPKVALARAGEGTLPTPPERPAAAPAGSLAAQTAGKANATAGRSAKPGAPARAAAAAPAAAPTASAAPAKAESPADLRPQVGTPMTAATVRRVGLAGSEEQALSRKASEVHTVFHRDLPDAAEAERRTRAVLRPNTPTPRQAEFDAAPFAAAPTTLMQLGSIARRLGSPESEGADYPQRAIKTDRVELAVPAGSQIKVGDRLIAVVQKGAFDEQRVVAVPTGVLEVVKADAGSPVLAVVRKQFGRIEQGQGFVRAGGAAGEWIKTQRLDTPDVATSVRWLDAGELLPTLQSYLLLGAGSAQGLKAGDEVALYHTPSPGASPVLSAAVRIVRTEADHASAIVTRQYAPEIAVGQVARRYAKAP